MPRKSLKPAVTAARKPGRPKQTTEDYRRQLMVVNRAALALTVELEEVIRVAMTKRGELDTFIKKNWPRLYEEHRKPVRRRA